MIEIYNKMSIKAQINPTFLQIKKFNKLVDEFGTKRRPHPFPPTQYLHAQRTYWMSSLVA
jgi:hypothetical protein